MKSLSMLTCLRLETVVCGAEFLLSIHTASMRTLSRPIGSGSLRLLLVTASHGLLWEGEERQNRESIY